MAEERNEQAPRAAQPQPKQERGERRQPRQKQVAPPVDRGDRGERGMPVARKAGTRRRPPSITPRTEEIDYKNVDFLQRFLTERGKIKARRKTGANATQQRRIARAIKRARHLALLPFTSEHIRGD